MRIYTKTGDDGTTGLFGGKRVMKDHPRVEAYGTVDELNCYLGLVRSGNRDPESDRILARIQSDLFVLGADLATPAGAKAATAISRIKAVEALWMEEAIDRLQAGTPEIRSFILPGGDAAAAALHVARAICRRAERAVVRLSHAEELEEGTVIYLNRLSDLLFALARALNHRAGVVEEPWNP